MRYIYLFILLGFFSFNIYSQQPTVNIDLVIKNDIGNSRTLNFGLDSLASDSIDFDLGEENLPPWPPPTAFETRFLLPEGNFSGVKSTYKDYRNAPSFPFSGVKEHRLQYQAGNGTTVTLQWNFPPQITGVLQDIITGTLINYNMAGEDSFVVENPGAFNKLKMVITYNGIVPVELTSFSASLNNNKINLKWQTASELNNLGFDIERKIDNGYWSKIGFINGSGTTSQPKDYYFVNTTDKPGKVYSYRLKQIDFDGSYNYSNEVKVDIISPVTYTLDQNFPNPFNPSTTISFSIPVKSNVKLLVYNQIGELVDEIVNSILESGNYNYTWNAKNYSSGVYFYELQTDNFRSIRKMTLIK